MVKQQHLHIALLLLSSSAVHADWKLGLDGAAMTDRNGYQMQQSALQLAHTTDTHGQTVKVQWINYSLQDELNGVYAFSGNAPGIDASMWTLQGFHWLYASLGSDGSTDLAGLNGNLTYAHIVPQAGNVWKPHLSLKREAFASHPLPLSLETMRNAVELGLTRSNQNGELTTLVSVEQWQSPRTGIRTRNDSLLQPPEPIIAQAVAYWLPQPQKGISWGWASQISHSDITTQQATNVDSIWEYSWYPAAAPIWSGSVSALITLGLWNTSTAQWNSMLTLPLLSGQVRQWDTKQIQYWGTAPFKLNSLYSLKLQSWRLGVIFIAELAPWSEMQFWSDEAYQVFQIKLNLDKNF